MEDVSTQVSGLSRTVEDKLDDLFKAIRLPAHPDIAIGPRCDDPYTWPLHDHCWSFLPEQSVLDLLEPFRSFEFYHPAQAGSASMKAVLPALTGKGYGHLAIQAGDTASREYLRVTYGEVPEAERQRVRRQLEDYCGLGHRGYDLDR